MEDFDVIELNEAFATTCIGAGQGIAVALERI
jgi:hypothetical protein